MQNDKRYIIPNKPGKILLDALRNDGLSINAACGGNGTCGKCAVITPMGKILACKTIIDASFIGMEITIPTQSSSASIVNTYERLQPITCNRNSTLPYGLAIDIGTTTVAIELLNIKTGERIAVTSFVNSQREFGADVITRILSATTGAHSELNKRIKQDICTGILHILDSSGVSAADISLVVIAGNTTMLHLLLDYPCDSLGVAPFTPLFLDMKKFVFDTLFGSNPAINCEVIILPGMSTFVGADISAGLLTAGWQTAKGHNLLIDLGTNGEMTLFSDNGQVLVTSTAAGPALEAGNISKGMASVAGAIAKVSYNSDTNVFINETITNAEPIGICGTGVVDITAELIRHGLVDEAGGIESGEDAISITPGISFTQRDIREVQLAKSAVRAGLEILLDTAGINYTDLENVFLAGGFGYKINLQNAATLGIIPQELTKKVIVLGNSSLGGAAQVLLDINCERDIQKLTSLAKEVDLSTHPQFSNLFMEYMTME